ncbi:hypothetical protein [Bacillus cereus]|uniref:hypothetical protein n=1 Tax=Bacillus cereus TaxID=1396 RepID=UPI0020D267A9|nr:hypothetical protein [Bacillus cereus]
MKKYFMVMSAILAVMFLSACATGSEGEDIQMASLKDVDTIHIDHGSTKINIVSADIDEVEAYLLLNNNGPGILMDKEKRKL